MDNKASDDVPRTPKTRQRTPPSDRCNSSGTGESPPTKRTRIGATSSLDVETTSKHLGESDYLLDDEQEGPVPHFPPARIAPDIGSHSLVGNPLSSEAIDSAELEIHTPTRHTSPSDPKVTSFTSSPNSQGTVIGYPPSPPRNDPPSKGGLATSLRPFTDGPHLIATHGSRDASGLEPNLLGEIATMNHEFAHATRVSPVPPEDFARAIFHGVHPDGTSRCFWSEAEASATDISNRSDIRSLIQALRSRKEPPMYAPFEAIGKIAMLYDAQDGDSTNLPPDPFVHKLVGGGWAETDAGTDYVPTQRPSFRLVDTHGSSLRGFHIEEKPDFIVIRTHDETSESDDSEELDPSPTSAQSSRCHWGQCVFVFELKPRDTSSLPQDVDVAEFLRVNPLGTPVAKQLDESSVKPQVQAARYTMGPTSYLAPLRVFSLVALVEGQTIRLIYADRSGILMSKPYDYGTDPKFLVTLLIAITRCGSHALGFEKSLVEDATYPCEVDIVSVEKMSCTNSASGERDAVEETMPFGISDLDGKWFSIRTEGKNLKARPRPVPLPNTKGIIVHNGKTCSPRYLTGYASSVYKATAFLHVDGGPSLDVPCVAKFSWRLRNRVGESELYSIANKSGIANIANVVADLDICQLSAEDSTRTRLVRQCFKGSLHHEFDDRVLSVIAVTPLCIPLYKVTGLGDFLQAVLTLLVAHNKLYNVAKILHCDICPENLMVDAADHSRGILIDLDHAVLVHGETSMGQHHFISVGHRCMARALLELNNRPAHTYDHDLESFFWSLWDMVINYRNGVKEEAPNNYDNEGWASGSFRDMKAHKEAFLTDIANDDIKTPTPYRGIVGSFCHELGDAQSGPYFNFLSWWSIKLKRGKAPSFEAIRGYIERAIKKYKA